MSKATVFLGIIMLFFSFEIQSSEVIKENNEKCLDICLKKLRRCIKPIVMQYSTNPAEWLKENANPEKLNEFASADNRLRGEKALDGYKGEFTISIENNRMTVNPKSQNELKGSVSISLDDCKNNAISCQKNCINDEKK